MSAAHASDPARGRKGLLGLAALFLLPLAVAFWLYYGAPGWRPPGRANQGELLDPPRTLPTLELAGVDGTPVAGDVLRGHWTLLYIDDGRCDARCRDALHLTRQTRIALNQDADRVRRVLLAAADTCCAAGELAVRHPDLVIATPSAEQLLLLARAIPAADGTPLTRTGCIYVVDPLGNLILRYAPGLPDKALLDDLKRLLRLSHIG